MRAVLRRLHRDAGTTLIEVVVATAVFAVVVGLVFEMLWSSTRYVNDLDDMVQRESEARLVVDQFARELRQAYSGTDATPVIAIGSQTEVSFYSPDRSAPMRLRQITYRLDTATRTLQRGETRSDDAEPPDAPPTAFTTVLTAVSNTNLFAYDAGALSDIRSVTLRLDVDADTTKAPGPQEYTVTVDLRAKR